MTGKTQIATSLAPNNSWLPIPSSHWRDFREDDVALLEPIVFLSPASDGYCRVSGLVMAPSRSSAADIMGSN